MDFIIIISFIIKGKKDAEQMYMLRLVDDDIESPYNLFNIYLFFTKLNFKNSILFAEPDFRANIQWSHYYRNTPNIYTNIMIIFTIFNYYF